MRSNLESTAFMPAPEPAPITEPFRLHIGGIERRAGWQILNIQPGPHVDHVGDCADLSRFANDSVDEVYAAHVHEHLGYQQDLIMALAEIRRILKPGRTFRISVPDLDVLCGMFLAPGLSLQDRVDIMRMIFGGQTNPFDFHKVGLNWPILCEFLSRAGFKSARKVESFAIFDDCSEVTFGGRRISLNVEVTK